MNNKVQKDLNSISKILIKSKSSQKGINYTSKKRYLISPSKDLLVFFGNTNFNNFNILNLDKKDKKQTKLTLSKKETSQSSKPSQKKFSGLNPHLNQRQKYFLSVTGSTQSFRSNRNSTQTQEKISKQEKFQKLKKQVDQIRRKYSCKKMTKSVELNRVNSQNFLIQNSININNINSETTNSSKQKNNIPLTPKNERYLGKKILKKNMFQHKNNIKLRLTQNKFSTLNTSKHNSNISSKRKLSFQLQNLSESININSEIQQIVDNNKTNFQFTFGSMAMMDFQKIQNKDKLHLKQKILSL